MFLYTLIKTLHVLGAIFFLGVGAASAWYKFQADRSGDLRVIAWCQRQIVLADWMFTTSSALIMPLTGIWLQRFLVFLAAARYKFDCATNTTPDGMVDSNGREWANQMRLRNIALRSRIVIMRLCMAFFVLHLSGCADFTDLRPRSDVVPPSTAQADGIAPDTVPPTSDVATPDTVADDMLGADLQSDVSAGETVLAQGQFHEVNGYVTKGTAQVVRLSDGKLVLRLTNLSLPQAPGPGVLMTDRRPAGGIKKAEPGDIDFGLVSESATMLEFTIVGESYPKDVVVLCVPYGIEMGRAELEVTK